ncbi:MAG: sulfotransferase [Dokdonella sp.]
MQTRSAGEWLAQGRALVLRGDAAAALVLFSKALIEHPGSVELAHAEAGLLWQARRAPEAEASLQALLERQPDHVASAFLLAKILQEQGRMLAVETTLRSLFTHATADVGPLIQAIELLDDCGRKRAAADLVERAIEAGSNDPRLHAYAGMLDMQTGDFDLARTRYAFALAHDARALEWQSAYGYATSKRYAQADDADFAMMREFLERPALGDAERASVLFALGKMSDDVGDHAQAATHLREANRLVAANVDWSRKNWRRLVSARLDAKPLPANTVRTGDFMPIFIVGLPRSGTTLVAEWLARHPCVCNRGELNWIAHLAGEVARASKSADALMQAAATYRAQVRQDDTDAYGFIDKQPLNFLHVDLILALFPYARIVHCRRNSRDTALSIWMQHFAGREQAFAYDFEHISAVLQADERLMGAARKRHPDSLREVRYEEFVRDPEAATRALGEWIGLPANDWTALSDASRVISTASAWQARQPVHARSIGRWRAYAACVPELLQFPDD